jgi:hypothetical protein
MGHLRDAPDIRSHGARINFSKGKQLHDVAVQDSSVNNVSRGVHESEQGVVGTTVTAIPAIVEDNFNNMILFL